MAGFYGTFMHSIDPKNRVFIPAKLRAELGDSFYITRKISSTALAVYTQSEWDALQAKLNALPDSIVGDIKLFLFSHSVNVSPDSQGRILLPPDLTEYAEIEKELAIVGVGNLVLIYAAHRWQAEEAAQLANMDKLYDKMRELGL